MNAGRILRTRAHLPLYLLTEVLIEYAKSLLEDKQLLCVLLNIQRALGELGGFLCVLVGQNVFPFIFEAINNIIEEALEKPKLGMLRLVEVFECQRRILIRYF